MQALAAWLIARPQLGQDVFARGAPEMLGALAETDHQLDVIEFLWATIERNHPVGTADYFAGFLLPTGFGAHFRARASTARWWRSMAGAAGSN